MGGGGGFNPLSIISTLIFGPEVGGLVAMATSGSGSRGSSGGDASTQEAEQAAAQARQKADRRKAETALLAQARQAERAGLASQDNQAESLGAPKVAASGLKERLGQ